MPTDTPTPDLGSPQQIDECAAYLPTDAITADEVTGWRDEYSAATHQSRWNQVLEALGEDTGSGETPMTAAQAMDIKSRINNSRWDRTARTLEALVQCQNSPAPTATPVPAMPEPQQQPACNGAGSGRGGIEWTTVRATGTNQTGRIVNRNSAALHYLPEGGTLRVAGKFTRSYPNKVCMHTPRAAELVSNPNRWAGWIFDGYLDENKCVLDDLWVTDPNDACLAEAHFDLTVAHPDDNQVDQRKIYTAQTATGGAGKVGHRNGQSSILVSVVEDDLLQTTIRVIGRGTGETRPDYTWAEFSVDRDYHEQFILITEAHGAATFFAPSSHRRETARVTGRSCSPSSRRHWNPVAHLLPCTFTVAPAWAM